MCLQVITRADVVEQTRADLTLFVQKKKEKRSEMANRLSTKFQADFSEREWLAWKKLFLSYVVTQRARTPEERLAHLITQGGDELAYLLENLPPRNEDGVGLSVSLIARDPFLLELTKFDDYFESKETPITAVKEFRDLKQKQGEKAKMYLVRVREMARRCNFVDENRQVMEQFILGLNDEKVKQRALTASYSNVMEVLEHASVNETVRSTATPGLEINFVDKLGGRQMVCYYCKERGHTCSDCPKLKNVVCRKCRKRGHTARYCKQRPARIGNFQPSRRQREVRYIDGPEETDDREAEFIMHLEDASMHRMVYVKIGGVTQEFILDTGVKSNIVPVVVWRVLKERKMQMFNTSNESTAVFRAYGAEEPIKVICTFEAALKLDERESREKFFVLDRGEKCLLGWESAIKLDAITINIKNVGVFR